MGGDELIENNNEKYDILSATKTAYAAVDTVVLSVLSSTNMPRYFSAPPKTIRH